MESIIAHATREYPREALGILLGKVTERKYVVLVSEPLEYPKKGRGFVIDENSWIQSIIKWRLQGLEYIGIYHSHPDASPIPSNEDLHCMIECPGEVWLIISINKSGFQGLAAYMMPSPSAAHMRLNVISLDDPLFEDSLR